MAEDLAKNFHEAYNQASEKWQPYWKEAKKDLEFKMGKQWSDADEAILQAQSRDALVFNRIRRTLHVISGYERKNRLSLKVEPIAGDAKTANILSGCVQWQMTYENGYLVSSKAFENGTCTTGLNFVEFYLDYSKDPLNGDIKFRRVAHNELLLDPFFKEQDLSDCQYILRRRWLTTDQAKQLIPEKAKSIEQLKPKGRDNKFPEAPPAKDYTGRQRLKLDQFFRMESTKFKHVLNMLTGQLTRWEKTTKELDELLNSPVPQLGVNWGQITKVITRWTPQAKVAYLIEDKEMYDGLDPTGLEDYPFVAHIGYWEPEYESLKWKLQGVVRSLRDPQTESNKRRLKLLDILDSQLLGIKVKAGAVVDKEAPYRTGQGNVYWMTEDADVTGDMQPMQGPGLPPGLLESSKLMDADMDDMIGLSGEVTGMPDEGEAAQAFVLAKLRQAAGLTVFQPLMDNKRDADKNSGQKLIRLVQIHYGPEKVQRITNQQPTKEFYDKNFGKYDCIPSEGALTDSQRQMRYGEAVALKTAGAPIPWSKIFEYSALEIGPEFTEIMQKQEQTQQQLQQQKIMAELMREKARAALDQAKAEAMQSKSGLDRVTAMEQIANMRDDQLYKLLELALKIEKEGGLGMSPSMPQLPSGQDNVIPMRPRADQLMTTR